MKSLLEPGLASRRTVLLSAPLMALSGCATPAPDASPSHSDIEAFLKGFIDDFERLDWPRFRARFTEDSSIFFPPRFGVALAAGRTQTDPLWESVFTRIRAGSGRAAAPFMRLRPIDLKVQRWGGCAVVTFTLTGGPGAGAAVDRRTLVLQHTPQGWLIAHLHGSTTA